MLCKRKVTGLMREEETFDILKSKWLVVFPSYGKIIKNYKT